MNMPYDRIPSYLYTGKQSALNSLASELSGISDSVFNVIGLMNEASSLETTAASASELKTLVSDMNSCSSKIKAIGSNIVSAALKYNRDQYNDYVSRTKK